MKKRLIIEQFDPARAKPGGIDTCIRGMIKYAPADVELWIAGVDAVGDKVIGEWTPMTLYGRSFNFMPVVRLNNADLRRRIPHSVQLMARLLFVLRSADFDEVQTHRVNSGIVAALRFRRTRKILLIHSSGTANIGAGSKSFFRFAPKLYRAVEHLAVGRSDKVVVFSRDGAARLSSRHPQVEFSPTWFDPDQFAFGGAEPTSRLRVLWACRIEPAKDPNLAIEAFANAPDDFELTVAGDGTLRAQMERRVVELGIGDRVNFAGSVDKSMMGKLMQEHDLLLMSSKFEGFSRSIVEALASGLPVVTTEGGDPNGLIVSGVNGARFSSSEDFAVALKEAASATSADCRSSVADLSADAVVAKVYR